MDEHARYQYWKFMHKANNTLQKFGWEIHRKQIHLIDFIRAKKITTVLDVGANVGQYAASLRVRGYRGSIVSFEPDPKAYKELESAARADPMWTVRNMAIGSNDGRQMLNISSHNVYNSFLAPTAFLREMDAGASTVEKTGVEIVRIDSLFDEFAKHECIFLKSDTQGYERHVLLGAANSLPKIIGVQLEIGCFELYEGQSSFSEMLELMRSYDFALALVWPNHYCYDDPVRLLEVDCVFVNGRFLGSAR